MFSIVAATIYIPPTVLEGSLSFSKSLQIFVICCLLIVDFLTGVR